MYKSNNILISIIGLGYVGLPLTLALSKKFKVIGHDINKERVRDLNNGYDRTNEIVKKDLKNSLKKNLTISSKFDAIKHSDVI